ncbi:hypothetical protein MTR67_035324 [Solanum verrucosum]|uniref:Uncharacterized protein n=1 Tax=Solanum verrucosum TaxID=315347 RepID=A0AAF0UAB6_SOLVR|nr:hypothetical protein MTR67_035324 [Solanum verrucosum]
MPKHTADLLSCWIRRDGSKSQKRWWKIIPHCIWWTVWRERNSRRFEDKSNSIHRVKWNCIVSLFFWWKTNKHRGIRACRSVRLSVSSFSLSLFFCLFCSLLKVSSKSLMLRNTTLPFKKKTSFKLISTTKLHYFK